MKRLDHLLAASVGGWIVGWLLGALAAWLLFGCSPRIVRVPVSTVQDVRIVAMPSKASCYLSEMPSVPQPIELNFDDDDVIRRTMVSIREHNDLVQWAADVGHWMESVRICLGQITGEEL